MNPAVFTVERTILTSRGDATTPSIPELYASDDNRAIRLPAWSAVLFRPRLIDRNWSRP